MIACFLGALLVDKAMLLLTLAYVTLKSVTLKSKEAKGQMLGLQINQAKSRSSYHPKPKIWKHYQTLRLEPSSSFFSCSHDGWVHRLVIELWFVIFQNCSKPNTSLYLPPYQTPRRTWQLLLLLLKLKNFFWNSLKENHDPVFLDMIT